MKKQLERVWLFLFGVLFLAGAAVATIESYGLRGEKPFLSGVLMTICTVLFAASFPAIIFIISSAFEKMHPCDQCKSMELPINLIAAPWNYPGEWCHKCRKKAGYV